MYVYLYLYTHRDSTLFGNTLSILFMEPYLWRLRSLKEFWNACAASVTYVYGGAGTMCSYIHCFELWAVVYLFLIIYDRAFES